MNIFFLSLFITTVLIFELSLNKAASSPKSLKKWKNNQVYYRFTKQYDEDKMKIIRNAVKDIEKIVCVNITEVTDPGWKIPKERLPIQIIDDEACWSNIGQNTKTKNEFQELSLSDGCITNSQTKHEFMHLLGLEHEQSRSDRDKYIAVDNNRIEFDKKLQFELEKTKNYGPFDFQSNMLYTPWKFTKKPGKPIWTVKKGQGKYDKPLERGSISWEDAKSLNQIYECGKKCKNKCKEEQAYLNKDCECVTPDKFAEQQCFDVRDDCEALKFYCRTDEEFTGECRKTCKSCYKSPNGIGERGTIEVCEDSDTFDKGFCKSLRTKPKAEIEKKCGYDMIKFYCRKTCKTGCLYIEIPEVVDKCQDLEPLCPAYVNHCMDPAYQERCAKTCGICY